MSEECANSPFCYTVLKDGKLEIIGHEEPNQHECAGDINQRVPAGICRLQSGEYQIVSRGTDDCDDGLSGLVLNFDDDCSVVFDVETNLDDVAYNALISRPTRCAFDLENEGVLSVETVYYGSGGITERYTEYLDVTGTYSVDLGLCNGAFIVESWVQSLSLSLHRFTVSSSKRTGGTIGGWTPKR